MAILDMILYFERLLIQKGVLESDLTMIVEKRSMSGTMSWEFTASDGSTAIICSAGCRCMTFFILCVKGLWRYRSGSNLSRSFAILSCSSVH